MELEGDATHFSCGQCSSTGLVEDGHITKVAYSVFNINTQNKFSYRPYWIMLCDKCFECKEEKKEEKKDDGNNNTKQKKSA